jgi:hypothetical protein
MHPSRRAVAVKANRRSLPVKRAQASGRSHNGAPGLRPHYHANYYGAFVLDPDGNNIEAVCYASA